MFIIGCDEVGYGCLAGPLVVCGVRAPQDWNLTGLNDSKKLSEKRRLLMRDQLLKLFETKAIEYHLAERSNEVIDKFGVAVVLKDAYVECFLELNKNKQSQIIVDGILKFDNLGVDDYDIKSVIKADTKIPTVMAASIMAKTYRDEKMKALHGSYPVYNWASNVGYGSKEHLEAIATHGPCSLHRFSYAPMKNMKVVDSRQLSFKDF